MNYTIIINYINIVIKKIKDEKRNKYYIKPKNNFCDNNKKIFIKYTKSKNLEILI